LGKARGRRIDVRFDADDLLGDAALSIRDIDRPRLPGRVTANRLAARQPRARERPGWSGAEAWIRSRRGESRQRNPIRRFERAERRPNQLEVVFEQQRRISTASGVRRLATRRGRRRCSPPQDQRRRISGGLDLARPLKDQLTAMTVVGKAARHLVSAGLANYSGHGQSEGDTINRM
jgi:hypothetical protein